MGNTAFLELEWGGEPWKLQAGRVLLGKVPNLVQSEAGNDHTTIYGSFSLRQPQPYMGKSAPLEAELRRWSLKGHS